MRSDYEERKEARRDRLEDASEAQKKKASQAFDASSSITDGIPMGQPILVGHHSEKRHRRAIDRSHSLMGKGIDAQNKAKELARRADAVGTAGISSDDPKAVQLLKEKLQRLGTKRDLFKLANKAYKASKKKPSILDNDGPYADSLPESTRNTLRTWTPPYSFVKTPFDVAPLGAEMRRIDKRIEALKQEESTQEAPEQIIGSCTIEENKAENRVFLHFPSKPSEQVRSMLKTSGFRWNRTAGAWSRMLNNSARYVAKDLAERIAAL